MSLCLCVRSISLFPRSRPAASRLSDLLPAADGDDADPAADSATGAEAMAVDGRAAGGHASANGAGGAASDGSGRAWLQEEVLGELRGPLALSSKPEAR